MLYTILIIFHVVLAASLIAIVLVQRGPGATMGAAFGAGASGTVFGARGSASFLTRMTTWMGIAFFALSLSMAVILARTEVPTASPDDLGVAAALESEPAQGGAGEAQERPVAEEEFLNLPTEPSQASQSAGAESTAEGTEVLSDDTQGDDAPGDDAEESPEPPN